MSRIETTTECQQYDRSEVMGLRMTVLVANIGALEKNETPVSRPKLPEAQQFGGVNENKYI